MSALTQQLFEEIESLPQPLKQEALQYIEYLKTKACDYPEATTDHHDGEPRSTKLVRLMEEIAQRGTAFCEIEDPAAWQREIREDKPLPGRE